MKTKPNEAPKALDAERAVLGWALKDPTAAQTLVDRLNPGDYFEDRHRVLHTTIASLVARGKAVTPATVAADVWDKRDLTGGSAYLLDLMETIEGRYALDDHIKEIHRKASMRRISAGCQAASQRAQNGDDPGDIFADLWEQLHDLDAERKIIGPIVTTLADVEPEDITWLWPGRIAIGKISLVVGDPGLGKSFLTLDLASRISRGAPWPDGEPSQLGHVVLLTAEDGIADTVRRRVDGLGGDPARIHVLEGVGDPEKPGTFTLTTDLMHLEATVLKYGANLVVIDPLSAYLGDINSHQDADVRGSVMKPLAAMAERTHTAVVCVVHMNKSEQRKAMYRAQGSMAFVAAARAIFVIAEDQEEDGRRLFGNLKMNLAPKAPTLGFRIDQGCLVWAEGSIDVDVNEAMAGEQDTEEERTAVAEAVDFLREVLADGSQMAKDIFRQARVCGISKTTLKRAKKKIKLYDWKTGFPGQPVWSLTPKEP